MRLRSRVGRISVQERGACLWARPDLLIMEPAPCRENGGHRCAGPGAGSFSSLATCQ